MNDFNAILGSNFIYVSPYSVPKYIFVNPHLYNLLTMINTKRTVGDDNMNFFIYAVKIFAEFDSQSIKYVLVNKFIINDNNTNNIIHTTVYW